MSIKHKIIEFLENNRGKYLSGEQIAAKLGVTRAAVWKGIKTLKEEGYKIEAVTNRGYMLDDEDDSISQMGILKYLKNKILTVEVYEKIDSTNRQIKLRADEKEGLVIVAREQSNGKARQGKYFFSPKDTGVYFSILLKPKCKENEAFIITLMAGVAVCSAIEEICDVTPIIKGVNDIYIDDKKICGILTQASFSLEDESTEYIALGIGMNMYPPENGFPDEIKSKVGAIYSERQGNVKNKLIAKILDDLWDMYNNQNKETVISKYKEYNKNSEVTIKLS